MLFCVVWNYKKSARLDFLSVFFVSNTNWNIINEYDKVLHGSMYFNVQVFLQKVMLCLFSLSIIQFSCSCLVKMCQFNCRSTSSQTVPLSSFDIQEEQLNCIRILKRKTFLFLKFSIIISAIVEAERGENPFPNPLCARRGEKGEGDADGQVLWLSDWFTRTSPVIPLFHYATTAEQYHSTKVPQQNRTKVPPWWIYQNQPRHTPFPLRYHSRTVPQYHSDWFTRTRPVLYPYYPAYYSTTVSSTQHCPLPNIQTNNLKGQNKVPKLWLIY